MEQTVSERPFHGEQLINQPKTWHYGSESSSGAHFQQDSSQSWCPGRRTGWSENYMPSGRLSAHNNPTQDNGQISCRDFLRGKCGRGASCRFRHPEFDTHSGSRCDGNDQQRLGALVSSGVSYYDGANKDQQMSFSRDRRTRSPCRKFQSGRCSRGTSCPYLHSEHSAYVRPRHGWSSQHHQVSAAISRNPDFGEGSVGVTLRTSEDNYKANMEDDLRTRSFSRRPRSRSPCRNFLQGRCYRGESCPRLHIRTTSDHPGYVWSRQQHHEVAATSRNNGFGEVNIDMSQEHDRLKVHAGSSFAVNDISVFDCNKQWHMRNPMQPSINQENMDVDLRSWSSDGQRSRPAGSERLRREVCLKFCRGRCTLGESCKYLHSFHEYARSIPDWNNQPLSDAPAAARNFGGANQYATTMRSQETANRHNTNVMSQEHNQVKSENIRLSEYKNANNSFVATDGSFRENIEGQVADDAVKPDILDQKGEAFVREKYKCEISRLSNARDGYFAEGNRDTNLSSRPFKRQRSRSRSPFDPRDDFRHRRLRRDDSHINFPRCRFSNAVPFRYPYSRSYSHRHDGRPRYRMDNRQHSTIAASSVDPCSPELNKCSDLVVVPEHDEVVSHGLQIDQCSGGIDSNTEIVNRKSEVQYEMNAEKPRDVNQNDEEAVTDTTGIEISKVENANSLEVVESDSTSSCEKLAMSAEDNDMSILDKEDNVEVDINMIKEGNEATDETREGLKTYSRKSRRRMRSKSCLQPSKEEVIEASTPVLSISSLGETSLSHPDVASGSGVLEEMKKSAVVNSSTRDMLATDLPVEKLEQENGVINNKNQNNVESTPAITEVDTSLVDHSMPTSQSASQVPISNSRRKLLVLDLNGILADIVSDPPARYKPHTTVSRKSVFKRPFCDDFLQFCFERFDVGVWSSRTKKNVTGVVNFLLGTTKSKLLFCWDQSHCTETGYKTIENKEKPLVLKELKKLWDKQVTDLPWDKGFYDETNTVLLDDSPYKALRNPPYTAIFPHPYTFRDVKDKSLGPGGELRVYLERLAAAENVPKFIQENPFGQRPITQKNLSWGFYSKIVGSCTSHQQEVKQEGNATTKTPADS